jgi:hypothetical protein
MARTADEMRRYISESVHTRTVSSGKLSEPFPVSRTSAGIVAPPPLPRATRVGVPGSAFPGDRQAAARRDVPTVRAGRADPARLERDHRSPDRARPHGEALTRMKGALGAPFIRSGEQATGSGPGKSPRRCPSCRT